MSPEAFPYGTFSPTKYWHGSFRIRGFLHGNAHRGETNFNYCCQELFNQCDTQYEDCLSDV